MQHTSREAAMEAVEILIITLAAICMAESANLAGDALLRKPVWQQCAALKLSTQL